MGKYEYMLHTWGGFYHQEFKDIHGLKDGYYWFDTLDERSKYISELMQIEDRLNTQMLAFSTEDGLDTRRRTIAKMVFIYQGKEYSCVYDFGFAYPADAAEYMFTDGNYGCDCNRSLFIGCAFPEFPEMECGEEIEMENFVVEFSDEFTGNYSEP